MEGKGGGAREQDFASDGANEAEAGGEDAQKGTQDGSGDGLRNGVQDSSRRPAVDIGASTKRCPSCHVPIFRDGEIDIVFQELCAFSKPSFLDEVQVVGLSSGLVFAGLEHFFQEQRRESRVLHMKRTTPSGGVFFGELRPSGL